MSDLLTEAFATFVEEAGREVVTPPAAHLRRVVVRRRKSRIALASVAAILVIASGVGVFKAIGSESATTPAGQPAASAYDTAKLDALRRHALDELGKFGKRGTTVLFTNSLEVTSTLVSQPGQMMAKGRFTVEVQCYGVGVVTVRWTIGATTKSDDVGCVDSDSSGATSDWLQNDAASSGPSRFDFTPNEQCLGRCSVAYRVVFGWDNAP